MASSRVAELLTYIVDSSLRLLISVCIINYFRLAYIQLLMSRCRIRCTLCRTVMTPRGDRLRTIGAITYSRMRPDKNMGALREIPEFEPDKEGGVEIA